MKIAGFILVLAVTVEFCCGQGNHVLDLTRSDTAYVDYGGSASLKPTESLTFGCWAWHHNWQSIDNKPTIMGNTQHVGFCLSLIEDKLVGWISVDSVYQLVEYPTKHINPGWHHLVVLFNGEQVRLVVDGKLKDEKRLETKRPIVQPDSTITFMLGAESRYNGKPHPGLFFDGKIDDAFIFNDFLDLDQIKEVKEGRLVLSESLVLWDDFEGPNFGGVLLNEATISEESFVKRMAMDASDLVDYSMLFLILLSPILLLFIRDKQNTFLVLAYLLLNSLSFFLSFPSLGKLFLEESFFSFWTPDIAHCLTFISFAFLLKPTRLNTKSWLQINLHVVLLGIGVLFLILPIYIYQWFALLVIFSLGVHLTIFHYQQKKLGIAFGTLGVFVIGVTYLLDLVGLLRTVSESPVNSYVGYLLLSFGFLPVLGLKQRGDIQFLKLVSEVLSEKELEVAKRIADGKKDVDIAFSMGISVNTVKTYNKRIFSKLKLRGRKDIAKFIQQ